MVSDNIDNEPTEEKTESPTYQEVMDSSIPRRGALTLLGLLGLGSLGGHSTAGPPPKRWNRDQNADGYDLYDLGALTMDDNSEEITDFEGDGLEISDNELTIDFDALPDSDHDDLEEFLSSVGRYLEFDDDEEELNFTGAAEWSNSYEDASNVADGKASVVAGGKDNTADGKASVVAGGKDNTADGKYAFIGGGDSNEASGYTAVIGGGVNNYADKAGVIGGGKNNSAKSRSFVGAGSENSAEGILTTIGGGYGNSTKKRYGTVGGGEKNKSRGYASTVSGGADNTATGKYATVPGGNDNRAKGEYSFGAGHRAIASHDGALVFGNSTNDRVRSENTDEVRFQAGGGFVIEDLDSGDEAPLTYDSDSGEILVDNSSARYKENIEPLDADRGAILDLEPRSFEYTESGKDGIGLIAEEVMEHVPELVVTDNEGRPEAVRYDRLGVYLISEVRRQRDENAELRERLAAIEEQIGLESAAADGGRVEGEDDT